MRKNYDFSAGIRGKFFAPEEEIRLPVYLDRNVQNFLLKKMNSTKNDLSKMVNLILKKEIEILEQVQGK